MKLQDMSNEELSETIKQLERTIANNMDKYKRWEAEQKLKLAKAELSNFGLIPKIFLSSVYTY